MVVSGVKTAANFLGKSAAALCVVSLAAVGQTGFAASPMPALTIPNPIPEALDNFGRNIMATPEGVIVAGAAGSDVNGVTNGGEVHLIDGATGAVLRTLRSPDPQQNLGFGAFAWAGPTRVVVATAAYTGTGVGGPFAVSGRVELFDFATGAYQRTINNPTPGTEEYFGYGLGMLGDNIIASSRGDDTDGLDAGIVYLFDGDTGAILRTFHNPAPTGQDNFGYSVAGFGGNKIAVTAPGNDTGATDAGQAYVFNADTGALLYTIPAPDPAAGAQFGFQVRPRGNDLIIGSPGQQKAYLFDGNTGEMLLRLNCPEPHAGGVMGSTVSAVGHHILVGNPYEPFGSSLMVGRAYLLYGNSGAVMQIYDNPTPEAEDRYGIAVTGVNGNVVVSADQDKVGTLAHAGSLYVYTGPQNAAADWALYW
jgi:hypothetical protein